MATNFVNDNISSIQISGKRYNIKSIPFHATEAEWNLRDYTPKCGEVIVYDADETYHFTRFKFGDGITNVNELPFYLESEIEEMVSKIDYLAVNMIDTTCQDGTLYITKGITFPNF